MKIDGIKLKSKKIDSCAATNFKKGVAQIDYIIAIGLFVIIFAVVVQTLINSFSTAQATSESEALTTRAFSLLGIADFEPEPPGWTGTGDIDRIGLRTRAYRFVIAVNNTNSFLINQSDPVADLTNELIRFNYSEMGFPDIDVNSTYITDGSTEVAYNITNQNITFRTNINANQVKYFTVYFDDDSNFTSRSVDITGGSNLTETLHAVQPMSVLQFKKIQALNGSVYTDVKNSLISDDFNITIEAIQLTPKRNILSYGGETPLRGNIVALQRYFIFQNSTAGIRQGKIIIRTF